MKLIVVIYLLLAVQSRAEISRDSSEEDYGLEFDTKWQSDASSLPAATSYKIKVTQRLENSKVLKRMAHLKEKLYNLADEKLEKCVKLDGKDLDRHCLGRTVGEVMQLISSIENSNRYNAYIGARSRIE